MKQLLLPLNRPSAVVVVGVAQRNEVGNTGPQPIGDGFLEMLPILFDFNW